MSIRLIQIFRFYMEFISFIINSGIVHIDAYLDRFHHLGTQRKIPSLRKPKLPFQRIIQCFMPFLLFCQSGAIEQPAFKDERQRCIFACISQSGPDITYITNLFSNKRTVSEKAYMRRTVRINRKRNPHLSDRKVDMLYWENTSISIQHTDFSLIGQIYFRFISHDRKHIACQAETGIPYLKTTFVSCRLIFVFCTDRSMDCR